MLEWALVFVLVAMVAIVLKFAGLVVGVAAIGVVAVALLGIGALVKQQHPIP